MGLRARDISQQVCGGKYVNHVLGAPKQTFRGDRVFLSTSSARQVKAAVSGARKATAGESAGKGMCVTHKGDSRLLKRGPNWTGDEDGGI